jgi:hypothetical protein
MPTAAEYNDIEAENIKRLILALEELDDTVIETVRELVLAPGTVKVAISENALQEIENSRHIYQTSNYNLESMFQYLISIQDFRKSWISVTRSLAKAYNSGPKFQDLDWKFSLRSIQNAGDKAWRAAVPASKTLGSRGGAVTINNLIAKFGVFDEFMDLAYSNAPDIESRVRFSDELNDTL